jgi:nucleolar GTP-binding protein
VVKKQLKKKKMDESLARSASKAYRSHTVPRDQSIKDPVVKAKVKKIERLGQRKMNYRGKAGESDRHIGTKMPKHLFAGKRGAGKTDRR